MLKTHFPAPFEGLFKPSELENPLSRSPISLIDSETFWLNSEPFDPIHVTRFRIFKLVCGLFLPDLGFLTRFKVTQKVRFGLWSLSAKCLVFGPIQ